MVWKRAGSKSSPSSNERLPRRVPGLSLSAGLQGLASDIEAEERCEYYIDDRHYRIYYGNTETFDKRLLVQCPNRWEIKHYTGCIHEHVRPIHVCKVHSPDLDEALDNKTLFCGKCLMLVAKEHQHQCPTIEWKQVYRDGTEARIPVRQ